MKNVITLLMCTLFVLSGLSQTESSGGEMLIPERTPELNALYQQAKQLEEAGSAAEINANRLAIKNAWQTIDPAVAALYKPVAPVSVPRIAEGNYDESRSPEDWDTDKLLREGYIDWVDMDVTADGDIYVAAIERFTGTGSDSSLYVYRSTDGGNSFVLWKSLNLSNVEVQKMQVVSFDGTGNEYLIAYMNTDTSFFGIRINMATGDFESEGIANDVTEFSLDRDWPGNTNATRVYAIYTKESASPKIYSARSTSGSYGFDWVDETPVPGANLGQIAFAYGRLGMCYTTYLGLGSGNLYARPNTDYNDPGSWGSLAEYVTYGTDIEVRNPTIRAARNTPSEDNVIIFTSSRDAGSTGHYNAKGYKRVNSGNFAEFTSYSAGGGGDWNIVKPDSWIRRVGGVETIRTSYIRENIDGSENNANRSLTYNGNDFDPLEPVADTDKDVYAGFPAAIAETGDGLPCMAFAGSSSAGSYGYNLYFDAKTDLVGIEENLLEGFTFYPNPVRETLNIASENKVENISIYSLLGQEVMQISPEQKSPSINVSSLAPGVYVMKVKVDGQLGTYKIIKK
ncbi:T9SS type A sorting domain-containing protein [Aequorivita capsosiphonis]|uniref:T9SS type A sorting domain-containing protein n=1 Tax=Aequorivita capsosiphonis TaxID=487317 RepID=UPI000423B815|nr:T9SS type A sorting domain-containing protein [Aequorivita capsosiphonis]